MLSFHAMCRPLETRISREINRQSYFRELETREQYMKLCDDAPAAPTSGHRHQRSVSSHQAWSLSVCRQNDRRRPLQDRLVCEKATRLTQIGEIAKAGGMQKATFSAILTDGADAESLKKLLEDKYARWILCKNDLEARC